MCHHRDFRTEWDSASEDEDESEADPTPDIDYEDADDVEILTDGGDDE